MNKVHEDKGERKKMKNRQKYLIGWVAVFCLFFLNMSCKKTKDEFAWMDNLHEKGRTLFYQTIKDEINVRPERSLLSKKEMTKLMEADTRYDRLYELIINIFYQKDEPEFLNLLEVGDKESKSRFKRMYSELARLSAHQFVESLFATDSSTEFILRNMTQYKNLDAADLVVRSIGYDARLDIPERVIDTKPLSPEFDKQGALDAAGFREAHRITKGNGAKIAILDTGIDESHPIFKNTKWGKHFSFVGREGKPWKANAPLVDWGYHGTLISSVAARYAPKAQITMYKFGDGDTQNDPPYQHLMQCMVAAAIYKAVHDGNDIISISASGSSLDSDYLREACQYAFDNNRIIISGTLYNRWFKQGNVLNFPAQYETVMTVTAAEKREDGTYGYWDVCAPHETNDVAVPNDIFGAFPTYVGKEDTYIPSISAAIPVVSALSALIISEYPRKGNEVPGEYTKTVMNLIKENANPQMAGYDGFSKECGYGLIDAQKTVQKAVLLAEKRKAQQIIR